MRCRARWCPTPLRSRGWFTGDTFGLSYREFDTARGPWLLPTTTPVQFEPEAQASYDLSAKVLQAIKASTDPRVTMTIAWNSGLLPPPAAGAAPSPAMEYVPKEHLQKLHAPIAWINGDPGDIAHKNAKDDFERTDRVSALFAWREGMGHNGTYREANGGELGRIAVAYLNWRLKGDKAAAKMFVGPDCGLCRDKNWHVFRKKID